MTTKESKLSANDFIRWLQQFKQGTTDSPYEGIYIISQGHIQAFVEDAGEWLEVDDKDWCDYGSRNDNSD